MSKQDTAKPVRAGCLATTALTLLCAAPAHAQDVPSFNTYGGPGLIDMPSAHMAPDATLTTSASHSAGTTRSSLTFQILPRLSGTFRYSSIEGLTPPTYTRSTYYDRSFDLRYQIITETALRPAVTIGLQDFIGTGLYGGEYIVASKSIGTRLSVTGGLGWGRLGSYNAIGATGNRPAEVLGLGGVPTYDRWFRGDVAPFAGLSYKVTDRLTFKAEYSSDAYVNEASYNIVTHDSPFNFGLDYRLKGGGQLSVYSVHGNEFGAMLSFHINPKQGALAGGAETAPVPVSVRAKRPRDLGWASNPAAKSGTASELSVALQRDGLAYEGLDLRANSATLRMVNTRYGADAQAVGRAARVMSRVLPASVETFVIVPVVNGVASGAVTIQRSDLEQLENAPADDLLARAKFSDGYNLTPGADAGIYPRLNWSLSPYFSMSFFDPDSPVRASAGLRLQGQFYLQPNLVLSGALTKKLAGNQDKSTLAVASTLPKVRTDYARYNREGDPAIEHLTLTHFGRPGRNLYSRVSAGYLEEMYAGVSGELLWKPVDSRLALGAELNYVKQRDFDQMFGLQSYDVLMGHVSAYYDFGNGFHGQLDVGRYLAGDIGATVSLDREFANGWRVGAYATVTDVPFDDFGEGSFDKGVRVTVPLEWAIGRPSKKTNTINIRSLTRDGGAQLNLNDRLYEKVRTTHRPDLAKEWGRVWR
ncbi:MAG: YjbH domain-containing protein [Paracoccaceae bacterium]